ncbi:hypothetical protein V1477_003446 [Vespula maculifrons]|uniref:Uncharacterized protein n=1 Tax=Vespula maculifrons TaxID=7453 RepID=A0ABD2CSS4_VESMC
MAEEKGGNVSKRKEEEKSLTILETGLGSTRLNSDSRFARYLRYFFERESSSPEVLPSDLRVPSAAKFMPSLRSTSMSGSMRAKLASSLNQTKFNQTTYANVQEKDNWEVSMGGTSIEFLFEYSLQVHITSSIARSKKMKKEELKKKYFSTTSDDDNDKKDDDDDDDDDEDDDDDVAIHEEGEACLYKRISINA